MISDKSQVWADGKQFAVLLRDRFCMDGSTAYIFRDSIIESIDIHVPSNRVIPDPYKEGSITTEPDNLQPVRATINLVTNMNKFESIYSEKDDIDLDMDFLQNITVRDLFREINKKLNKRKQAHP